ncbi:hypothetical protein EJB05_00936, partial [Eragrostis curvula]
MEEVDEQRLVLYPPIHDVIDRWGDLVHRVELRDRNVVYDLGDELPLEEAHRRVRELLLMDLRNRRYVRSDFYPRGSSSGSMRRRHQALPYYYHAVIVEEDEAVAYGGTAASSEAVAALPETTSVKEEEGGCSYRLIHLLNRSLVASLSCLLKRRRPCDMEVDDEQRLVLYPPIHDVLDRWGDLVHRVELRDRNVVYDLGDELPLEEAHRRVRELLLMGLRNREYVRSDFYPRGSSSVSLWRRHQALPYHYQAVVEWEQAYGTPASSKDVAALPETMSVKEEGGCSVCLEDYKTGDVLRMMPCCHSFHEACIFTWLRCSRTCPLCRFPLPAQQQ